MIKLSSIYIYVHTSVYGELPARFNNWTRVRNELLRSEVNTGVAYLQTKTLP